MARRADINRDMSGKLLQLMADADLVRFYEVDGKRYGFIPKFRQRVQIKRTKHPLPPVGLMDDDSDAINKINDLEPKTTVGHPLPNSFPSVAQPSEPEPEVEEIPNSGISPAALVKTQPVGSVVDDRDLLGDVDLSKKKMQCPAETLKTVFNEECKMLPTITRLNDTRKKHLSARWEELDKELHFATVDDGVQAFREFFKKVQISRYLTGQKNGFRASFDWLMKPDNFLKTREGNYDDKGTGQVQSRVVHLPTAADFAADQEGL